VAFNRLGRRLPVLLAILAVLASAGFWAFRHVGRWLVRPDDLQHARAIVVLSGNIPYRAMEAAKIFHEGWAPEVWLLRDQPDDADLNFARLGIVHPSEQDYDQQVLERLGVPKESIRILEPPTTNTVSEIYLIIDELRKQNADKVIVVTSPFHTRRSKLIWCHVAGDRPEVIMRLASEEPTDPDHWWRATQDIQDVTHEVLGLIDARLDFIAKPR
jgi:uncharacterized SAM-binding protein YcdF (DUF218 family)